MKPLSDLRGWLFFQRKLLWMRSRWNRAVKRMGPPLPRGPVGKVVIVSADPWTLHGSKGDEAMMRAVIELLRAHFGPIEVLLVSGSKEAAEASRRMGYEPLEIWERFWDPVVLAQRLRQAEPDALVILGADVLDGYYSYLTSMQFLQLADLSHRSGIRTTILGFSFNERPDPRLKRDFERLSRDFQLNLRDPISLRRFQAFCDAPSRVVADAAFLLQPVSSAVVEESLSWMQARNAAGDRVLVVNCHPMLFPSNRPDLVRELEQSIAKGVQELMRRKPVSLVLLSHDYRAEEGDDVCLERIHAAIGPEFEGRVHYPRAQMDPAELKRIAGDADAVVSGRMHLAIASLGQGIPVLGLVYQGKFQGLFEHFGVSADWLVEPMAARDAGTFQALLERFHEELPSLTRQVRGKVPEVLDLAMENLRNILPPKVP